MKPNLDLLRAVAVLLVMCSHGAAILTDIPTVVLHRPAQLGVVLFFVHTSLVLMQSLDRQHLSGSALFKQFYIQRIFRIYPLSIVFVLCILVFGSRHWSTFDVLSNLALTQNLTYSPVMYSVLWSLPLEVQMYVVLPILYVVFRKRPAVWLLGLWLLSIPFAMTAMQISGRMNVLVYVPCFLGGVIAWRLQGQERLPAWMWPPALALACIAFVVFANPWENDYGRWLICLALGLTIPLMHQLQTPRLNAVSKTIAQYSYGIYLFHHPLQVFAFKTLAHQPAALQWLTFGVLIVLVPFAAYHLIEHPMIKLGHAWKERGVAGKVAAPAA